MTILVAFKENNQTAFVSDFRVSFDRGNQVDAICKFLHFDNRLSFFTAGSTEIWKEASNIINEILTEITINNVLSEEGPLFISLRKILEEASDAHGLFGGFGIYLDTDTKKNIVFEIKGEIGRGLMPFSEIVNGTTIIGSGEYIPNLKKYLDKKMGCFINKNGFKNYSTADILRRHLKHGIINCGGSTFEKLGISPIFNISSLIDSSFKMHGESIEGEHILNNGGITRYSFTFERTEEELVLINNNTKDIHTIYDITSLKNDIVSDKLFDPEKLKEKFDPAKYIFGDNIYFMNQNLFKESPNSNQIKMERIVYKTKPFYYKLEL